MEATVSIKDIASAHKREAEIATLRGISPKEPYAHDLLQPSPLFVREFTTKPDKAQLIAELETNLQLVDYQFNQDYPLATHVVLDSYRELIGKEGEWIRRAGEHCAVELAVSDESVPILHQIDKFWASSVNKQNLLARDVGKRDLQEGVLSGIVVNEELISARQRGICHFCTTGKRRQTVA